jgi:hypothetical protein
VGVVFSAEALSDAGLRLSLYEHADGVETAAGPRVVYDLAANEAYFGPARVDGHALRFELDAAGKGAALSAEIDVDVSRDFLMRCDRVDFPPRGVAYRHTHPGPGIRRLLCGEITIESGGGATTFVPGQAWFESGPEPVLAVASATEETAFVRVMILPLAWAGRRTIRYVNEEDEAKPKTQRPTVFLEETLRLP